MKSIFEFKSTLAFLIDRLGNKNQRRGLKSSLCKRMSCQTSHLSQVLSEKTQLTLEQGVAACEFFQLSELSKKYFMLLLQKERSGSLELREYYVSELENCLKAKDKLSERLKDETESLPDEAKEQYYSNWTYLAVHILTSIPGFDSAKSISSRLGLTEYETEQILQFLEQYDFIKNVDMKYEIGSRHLHIEKSDPLNLHHQINWRLKALEKVKSKNSAEVNYSAVYSLSKKDADVLKENILKLIKSNLKIVAPSKEETMYCTVIDFFKL